MDPIIEQASQIPQTNIQPTMTKDDWHKKYWFNSLQMITVINPKPIDWEFMVEMRHFMIPAGQTDRFPGVIANVYLDQMSKILAQDDEKLEYMSDPNLKKIYYDKLIVSVENLVQEHNPGPAYLKNVSPSAVVPPKEELAPWESGMERARDVAPAVAPPIAPEPPSDPLPVPKAPKPETKEFEHEGNKYKMVTSKTGKSMFYMNGVLTSEANYAKAASML